ncbi:hypothetical protein L1987_72781 [Smallanthus sonchifolius]|uniref:Uncharacterized protein n=1 Tax=Smallanthus sonchifolius TaxID=185202 RepID=A0ACB9AW65_9ASTR|nr:hypothetical protein L1987_72781 [Smallanthus sonchifolius]
MAESCNRRLKLKTKSPAEEMSLDRLSSVVLATIMTKLDVSSICAIALTCKSFRLCAQDTFKFLPNFHLLEIAAPIDPLRRLLLPNASLRSLKKLLSEVGARCKDLRSLHMHFVADNRGRIYDVCDLEELLRGCTQLEVSFIKMQVCNQLGTLAAFSLKYKTTNIGSLGKRRLKLLALCDELVLQLARTYHFVMAPANSIRVMGLIIMNLGFESELVLMFNASVFHRPDFSRVWTLASAKLTYLQIGYIDETTVIELLSPTVAPNQSPNHILPHVFPNLQKLCLSVDHISNTMVNIISNTLIHLTHLDLRDQPIIEPFLAFDLTDEGLQLINQHGRLKHLSLIRCQVFTPTFFRRVTDQGIIFMADSCTNMESICLAGFCDVTDTGFKTLIHVCTNLCKLSIFNGTRMTDLVFHDMHATSPALYLLTNSAVLELALNTDLIVLDFRDSKNIGDKALQAISKLPKLRTLLLDVTDLGLSYLQKGAKSSLVKLSVRGCKRLTFMCVSSIFNGGSNRELRELDLSNLPNLTIGGVLFLAKNRIPLVDLRMRECPHIGDVSVMVLASLTMADGDRWHGSSLRSLDLFECGGISKFAFQWLRKPYFHGLRWLGVAPSVNRELVNSLALNRPFLNLMTCGEEFGTDRWNKLDDIYTYVYDDADELSQWIFDVDDDDDDDDDGNGGVEAENEE